ncbi:MAG: MFS transporter [Proteobacteria bacterium]|nr:MFS transporter [Pseudomonadota bacterium]
MTVESASIHGLAPLRNHDFRFLLGGFAIGQMLMPLQFITQILWVQHNAPNDIWLILVALIGASRGVGTLIFGLYGGALADRYNRKTLLIVTQSLLIGTTVIIAALMYINPGTVGGFAAFFAFTFLSAGLQSIDAPTRLAIVPDVLGPELTPAGMSLNQAAAQLAMPVALFASGLIIEVVGFSGAFLLTALGHLAAVIFVALMAYTPQSDQRNVRRALGFSGAIDDIREGFRVARSHPQVMRVIALVVAMMAFGFPVTANLGPTWITTVVGVELKYVGFVVMTWGIGAFVAAFALARFPSISRRGAMVAAGALLFSVSFLVFVFDNNIVNTIIGNLGLGAGMTIAMVSSTILIHEQVPNEARGRVMSIFQLNMGAAQLMTMPVALLGQWLTLPVLFPLVALVTLIIVVAMTAFQPKLFAASTGANGP